MSLHLFSGPSEAPGAHTLDSECSVEKSRSRIAYKSKSEQKNGVSCLVWQREQWEAEPRQNRKLQAQGAGDALEYEETAVSYAARYSIHTESRLMEVNAQDFSFHSVSHRLHSHLPKRFLNQSGRLSEMTPIAGEAAHAHYSVAGAAGASESQ